MSNDCGATPRQRARRRPLLQYPGPTRAEVSAYTDAKVAEEYARLKTEPRPMPYADADDGMFILAYGNRDLDDFSEWSAEEITELRKQTHEWYRGCLRNYLHHELITEWVATLSDAECWLIVEAAEDTKIPISEKRYVSRDQLRDRAARSVYAQSLT